jgi:hypothetical protein
MALTYSETIHPTAVIDPDAHLAEDVQVDPYAIIEGRCQNSALDRIEGDMGKIAEVPEFVAFVRNSKIGLNPARSVDRAQRNL